MKDAMRYKKGDKVKINPKAYPRVIYIGEVLSKRTTKTGLLKLTCKFECNKMMLKDSFYESEILGKIMYDENDQSGIGRVNLGL